MSCAPRTHARTDACVHVRALAGFLCVYEFMQGRLKCRWLVGAAGRSPSSPSKVDVAHSFASIYAILHEVCVRVCGGWASCASSACSPDNAQDFVHGTEIYHDVVRALVCGAT